jgi:helicase
LVNDYKVVYEDAVGVELRAAEGTFDTLGLPPPLCRALYSHYGEGFRLSPPQSWAVNSGILEGGSDYLISAPTNSGKTLAAVLRMFTAAVAGRRSVYVAPLKALAEEKAEEFRGIASAVKMSGGPGIKISVTTGDYQLTRDFLGSAPPRKGEIVVCTPERLEVLLRNQYNIGWAREVDAYVIDEFHLLGDAQRGASMETLLTRIMTLGVSSSVIGLSATVGGIGRIEKWFALNRRRLQVCESDYRFPPLARKVVFTDHKDAFIADRVRDVLGSPGRSLLIFVYRKADAVRLALVLEKIFDGSTAVSYFHSGLPRETRTSLIKSFRRRDVRVLTTTTSLKLGINSPAGEVIIRDCYFGGVGKLPTADILQMMGRAGRGDEAGESYLLCERLDWAEHYGATLKAGAVEPIGPQLVRKKSSSTNRETGETPVALASLALSEIVARGVATAEDVYEFASRTYSASLGLLEPSDLCEAFPSLESGKLIYKLEGSEGSYSPTKLGRTVSMSGLSPASGAVLAAFLRALIRLTEKKQAQGGDSPRYLSRLTDLDYLFLAASSFEARKYLVECRSEAAVSDTRQYVERLPVGEKPLVNLWRSEASAVYPTRRLLSTLRFPYAELKQSSAENAFYRLLRTAVLLHRHSKGVKMSALASEFGAEEGRLEADLKPTACWVLSALASICDPRKCYKLERLRWDIRRLIENLTYGSNLGQLLLVKGVGRRSLDKLLANGIKTLEEVSRCAEADLAARGLTKKQAEKVLTFSRRKQR